MNLTVSPKLLLLAFLVFLFYSSYQQAAVKLYPTSKETAVYSYSELPLQTETLVEPFTFKGFNIYPLAEFHIRARVLGRENYYLDKESRLSPMDLALGWGNMARQEITSQLDINQGARWYHFRWKEKPPLPVDEILSSSANMHMIPANKKVASMLQKIKTGQMVGIKGQLIEVEGYNNWRWKSSLTRNDTGAGACEVVLVESITLSQQFSFQNKGKKDQKVK